MGCPARTKSRERGMGDDLLLDVLWWVCGRSGGICFQAGYQVSLNHMIRNGGVIRPGELKDSANVRS
jgi:hypothetical protein